MNTNTLSIDDLRVLTQLKIDVFNEDRRYWLVRTNGGDYFDDFYMDNFIGIEWDKIIPEENISFDELKKIITQEYPTEEKPGYIAAQILKFAFEFKKGDVVIIPGKNAKHLVFGELLDDDIYTVAPSVDNTGLIFEDDSENDVPFLCKRRKVRWIKRFRREEIDSRILPFLYAHNTIVSLDKVAPFIDRMLSDFYLKGDYAYYTYRIQKENDIRFGDMFSLMAFNQNIITFIKQYFPALSDDLDSMTSKIDVQSKGPFQLVGFIKGVLVFGLVSMFIVGGEFHYKKGEEFGLSSNGLVGLIDSVVNIYDTIKTHEENDIEQKYEELKTLYEQCEKELQITSPSNATTSNTEVPER